MLTPPFGFLRILLGCFGAGPGLERISSESESSSDSLPLSDAYGFERLIAALAFPNAGRFELSKLTCPCGCRCGLAALRCDGLQLRLRLPDGEWLAPRGRRSG